MTENSRHPLSEKALGPAPQLETPPVEEWPGEKKKKNWPCIEFQHFEPLRLVQSVHSILIEKTVKTVGKILKNKKNKKLVKKN